jgi:hypothetical protein
MVLPEILYLNWSIKENSATFAIQSSDATRKQYPLISNLTIHWKTTAYPLRIKWSTKPITAAFLYRGTSCFQLPGKFEDYNLQFEIDERLEYNLQNDLISNQTNVLAVVNNVVPLKYELFENDALILNHYNLFNNIKKSNTIT